MIPLLGLHAALGLGTIAFGSRLGRRGLLMAAAAPLATLIWLGTQLGVLLDGGTVEERTSWVPQLGLAIDLRLDGFGALMVVIIAGIGLSVLAYGMRYFAADAPDVGRLAGLLALFAGSMLGIVASDNLLLLYTFWELTSITSFLLIGNDHTSPKARAAALHALLITTGGGLAMLGGFVVLAQSAGTYRLSDILASVPSGTATSVGLVLILVGVATKSALYPFHSWLPGAMAAPTPVSAYLHSATMVKAGIYLLARLSPAFAVLGFWRPLVVTVGLVTMVAGAARALRQDDLKLLLAFSTVSQLGFMTVLFGTGTPEALAAGCLLLLTHSVFKAALFMVVGILDRQTGTRDLAELPPLDRRWWPVAMIATICCASMAGLPLLLGFIAKEAAFRSVADSGLEGAGLVLAVLVGASALTTAYCLRFVWGAFVTPHRRSRGVRARAVGDGFDAEAVPPAIDPPLPSPAFIAPAAALAMVTLLFGLVPGLLNRILSSASLSLSAAVPSRLEVWHGVDTPLLLSAATATLGLALFANGGQVDRILRLGHRLPSGQDAYLGSLRALNWAANRVTGVVQNGSLPIYTGVIMLTASVLPLWVFARRGTWPGWPEVAADPANLLISGVLIASALAAATIRRRLAAILFLGVTGYGMAALFVLRGAPDLALTQVAIETLSTVLFVLVLRKLPDRFERRSLASLRVLRVAIAGIVATGIFAFAILAGGSRSTSPVSDEMVERSLPDGHGRNVVNVILVDFRGLDTMIELTVLTSAAIGAVALARAGRRPPARRALPDERAAVAEART
ncbi:MAG: hydrogen gas-evolving membrane-bound hydrogenase subunit E [Acidimicrobiales bacterium]